MELHLFSTPGERDIRWVLDACRPHLEGRLDATVAYLPLASYFGDWMEYTVGAFDGLGQIEKIDTELMSLEEMGAIIGRASVAYVTGGNTFLLNNRLHSSGLIQVLQERIQNGLPFVGFSAGAIICGPNIITSKDMNMIETAHFDGLNLTPFNFFVHYAQEDGPGRTFHDDWLSEYQVWHDNPVVIMADGSYVRIIDGDAQIVRGDAWLLRKGMEKQKISPGSSIVP